VRLPATTPWSAMGTVTAALAENPAALRALTPLGQRSSRRRGGDGGRGGVCESSIANLRWLRMERICMETDLDISNIYFRIF